MCIFNISVQTGFNFFASPPLFYGRGIFFFVCRYFCVYMCVDVCIYVYVYVYVYVYIYV